MEMKAMKRIFKKNSKGGSVAGTGLRQSDHSGSSSQDEQVAVAAVDNISTSSQSPLMAPVSTSSQARTTFDASSTNEVPLPTQPIPPIKKKKKKNAPAAKTTKAAAPGSDSPKMTRIKTASGVSPKRSGKSKVEKTTEAMNNKAPYADTAANDADLLPSDDGGGGGGGCGGGDGGSNSNLGVDDKGVSPSFKGLNATARFDTEPSIPQADALGRMSSVSDAYDAIPLIEQIRLPRGGISMETKAVGQIQFGIPPETIKDSMRLGIPVPQVYIVPAERFCREMGPALGVNLAEFEFPAYFNFFVYKKQCTLVVDSKDAEENICRVFEETLLGPRQFRREDNSIQYQEEDFAPNFPRDAIPNFEKELGFFRILGDGSELTLEKLLAFRHFVQPKDGYSHNHLGVPPNMNAVIDSETVDALVQENFDEAIEEIRLSEDFDASTGQMARDELEDEGGKAQWTYARARWVGDVATVWPQSATEEQKKNRSVPRVEVFKMPSGTEYIIHDVDENNIIIGKARFSGHVKVSESMSVEGFGGRSILDEPADRPSDESFDIKNSPMIPRSPPSFYPPSFGVTILGNSHGFDASGSVSGYVLWINGRGVMIDPPPYSSATLEREGIRPRTIVGIILTHTHADHDAGAFQKVLTGSPVVVIATPTIYKSFIRKYAALASLSPALLRHSHRYKAAIIGQPLRFQGATFHFFYSLHAIPCVGFRVEWRGRSMVFTGDHMNKPDSIDKLEADGVLSKARADDLRNMPLQETDLLLHEAGAPPIHTPLEVLQKLPQRVKKRMYVVHTSNIPAEFSDLRVAPTGTAGTLRLDEFKRGGNAMARVGVSTWMDRSVTKTTPKSARDALSMSLADDETMPSPWSSASNEYVSLKERGGVEVEHEEETYHEHRTLEASFSITHQGGRKAAGRSSILGGRESSIPLVSMRPASSTDAWFILNLLSAVPFLSSLSYSSTMEVLETARVDAYCRGEIVVPATRRGQLLCVVWEGTCVERDRRFEKLQIGESLALIDEEEEKESNGSSGVWHAGDWTGPTALQPEKQLSGESDSAADNDIVAISVEGVKVITVEFSYLHNILKNGSALYRKYLDRQSHKERSFTFEESLQAGSKSPATQKLLSEAMRTLNVLDLLDQNSALRKLSAVQKRHLESLAEGPEAFNPGEKLWRAGEKVNKAILVVAGTASFVPRRRNAGSATVPSGSMVGSLKSVMKELSTSSLVDVDEMQVDVTKAVEEMGDVTDKNSDDTDTEEENHIQLETLFSRSSDGRARSMTEAHDFDKLSKTLMRRAESLTGAPPEDISVGSSHDGDSSLDSAQHIHDVQLESPIDDSSKQDRRSSLTRRRSSRARFANKVLGRLYSRRAFTGGLVFSRGHFLGDVSKMVEGLLSPDATALDTQSGQSFPTYGFGNNTEGSKDKPGQLSDMVIHESNSLIVHTSTLTAGKEGCVVLVFPKDALIPFLDEYPGLLLSLLGTQVMV